VLAPAIVGGRLDRAHRCRSARWRWPGGLRLMLSARRTTAPAPCPHGPAAGAVHRLRGIGPRSEAAHLREADSQVRPPLGVKGTPWRTRWVICPVQGSNVPR